MRPFTFPDLLDSFRRRCVKTLAIAVPAALLVGALVWELLPPRYLATALLQVHQFEQVMLGNAEERSAEFITYRDSQINYMRSHPVLKEALGQDHVRNCATLKGNKFPVEYLEEALKIEEDISPEFIRISLKGSNPEDAAMLVNAVQDAYLRKVVYNERERRVSILRQLEQEYGELDRKVKLNQNRIDQLAQDLGTGDAKVAAVIQSQLQEQIRDLQQDLQGINIEIRAEMTAREFLTERGLSASEPLTFAGGGALGSDDANINDPRQRLAEVQRLIRQYESQLRDHNHPDLMALKAEQAELTALFSRGGQLDADGTPVSPLEWLERQRGKIEGDIKSLTNELFETGTRMVALERERTSIESAEKIRDTLALDIENKRVELNAPERVEVIQAAVVPEQLDQTMRMQLSGLGLIATFGLTVGGFVLFEWFAHRIGSAADLSSQTGLRMIGTIPSPDTGGVLGTGFLSKSVDAHEWQQAVVESTDVVRTFLLRHVDPTRPASILVTSAASAEGKTTLASQLAASLARIGRRVVLVDCDFRSPDAHQFVNCRPGPGLSEFLRDEASLDEVCQTTQAAGLTFIPAGRADHVSLKALSNDGGKAAVNLLKSRFDFVVMDSSPLLFVAEPSMLAQNSDMVLLATRKDHSRVPYVVQSRDALHNLNVPLLGTVMVADDSVLQRDSYGYSQGVTQAKSAALSG